MKLDYSTCDGFELRELVQFVIANRTGEAFAQITAEENKPNPDHLLIDELKKQSGELFLVQRNGKDMFSKTKLIEILENIPGKGGCSLNNILFS